ncbi:GTPase [Actinotalea sp. K2]|uniref:GTPase n=1 Tax=Actinotalea sp. K2 TaxID=2939438 RepID=UPI0027DFEFEF|nr:GTPase [Actinotalea sp. K2]
MSAARRDHGPSLPERLESLAEAVRAGRGVLPEELLTRAGAVEDRAGHRLRLSADHTVVAFAGSTGSGKSSLVNAVVGEELAEVGVLRPTTAQALAVVLPAPVGTAPSAGSSASAGPVAPDGSGDQVAPLLDWLQVHRRHLVQAPPDGAAGGGLVLLDLPDHDSVETAHRLEAERLVRLVDLMVWVVDPQKYADAAVHERYLRELAGHRDVLLVVLNQIDRLAPQDLAACHRDLGRLLVQDGLEGVPVLDVSARTGTGVQELRAALAQAATRRQAARDRLTADVVGVAEEILSRCGTPVPGPGAARAELVAALEGAAGVPRVVAAVRSSHVLRARQATGWPPTRWLGRFRVDPLRRLHLGPARTSDRSGAAGRSRAGQAQAPQTVRTSVPLPGPAERARARAAVRDYVDAACQEAPAPWVLAARLRVEQSESRLADSLDQAVAGARVGEARRPVWWSAVGVLQWALLGVLVVGLGWLGVLAGLDLARMPAPEPPVWEGWPVPTLAAVAALVLGLLLAVLSRLVARLGAGRAARRAASRLRAAIQDLAGREVVDEVAEVLSAMDTCRTAAARAAGRGHR